LENRRSKDDEVSKRVWKAVEIKAEETGVAKTKGGRKVRRKRKEVRRKE